MRILFHTKSQSHAFWTGIALFLLVSTFAAFSDEQPPADSSHTIPVALADIEKVFSQARDFGEQMRKLREEVEAVDKDIRARRADAADAVILRKKREFLEREAALYGDTYKLIEIIVARICKARDVGVVIRFTSKSFDPHDRAAVLQTLNRFVIYTAGPDLTDEIVAELNR